MEWNGMGEEDARREGKGIYRKVKQDTVRQAKARQKSWTRKDKLIKVRKVELIR